jgi:hypothetical protein
MPEWPAPVAGELSPDEGGRRMQISYHDTDGARDARSEIVQAQQSLRGICRLLTLIDEEKLETLEAEDIADMLTAVGELGVGVTDAALESLGRLDAAPPPPK